MPYSRASRAQRCPSIDLGISPFYKFDGSVTLGGASATLPTVEAHLEHARELVAQVAQAAPPAR